MHILSTIGLVVCIISLSLMVVSVANYIHDRCGNPIARALSMTGLILVTLSVCYGLSVLINLE